MTTDLPDPILEQHLRGLPKIELHLHLEGSLTNDVVLFLAKKYQSPLKDHNDAQLQQLKQYRHFGDFAKLFMLGVSLLRAPEDFYYAMLALGNELQRDNVRYAEITWTPQLHLNKGHSLDDILAALNQARHNLEKQSGIKIRWITDLVRSYPEPSARIARWASLKRLQDEGVVALGLGGPEQGYPANRLSEAFTIAKQFGLPVNPHAGETAGPMSIWETLNLTQATRIGHGVRCLEDPALIEHLAKNAIALEICLSSNIQLGIFSSIERHPVKQIIDQGIPVILNTDDRALFSTSLTKEYQIAVQHAGVAQADIAQCLCHAVDHCYLPAATKDWLRAELQAP